MFDKALIIGFTIGFSLGIHVILMQGRFGEIYKYFVLCYCREIYDC